jgi:hypothetical protein
MRIILKRILKKMKAVNVDWIKAAEDRQMATFF